MCVHMLMRSCLSCAIMCSKTTHYSLLHFLPISYFSIAIMFRMSCLYIISDRDKKWRIKSFTHFRVISMCPSVTEMTHDTWIRIDSPLPHLLRNGICISSSAFSCQIVGCLASQWLLNIINKSPVDWACHIQH